jgi:hypothetical protein
MAYGYITKCSFNVKQIGHYISKRSDLVLLENKNPEYKDHVILLTSPKDEKCSIPRFRIAIDMVLKNIELLDLDDTTLYRAGLQSRVSFNLFNFKEILDEIISEYNKLSKPKKIEVTN